MNKQTLKTKPSKPTAKKVKSPAKPIPLSEEIRGLLREHGIIQLIAEALAATNRRTIKLRLPEIIELVALGMNGALGQKCDVLERPSITEFLDADRKDAAKAVAAQLKQCISSQEAIGKSAQEEMKRRLSEILKGKTLTLE